jgi:hypothetical protein
VDDEAVFDRLPDPDADERMAVDDKTVVALAQGTSNLPMD